MAMAVACMRALAISMLFLASIRLPKVTAAAVPEEEPGSGSYQFELIHVDANGNFSREELTRRALNRARLRAAMLLSAAAEDDTNSGSFSVPLEYSPKDYIMELKMGSTAIQAVADTGSDIIWTNQDKVCIGNPSFTPTNESCAKACLDEKHQCITCMINQKYGGGKKMKGFVGTEKVSLSTSAGTGTGTTPKDVTLVCAIEWSQGMLPEAGQGIVGLGRGAMSLVKQLGVTQFSYCLKDPLDAKLRSPLWFGGNAQSAAGGKEDWRTTPLVEISTELSEQPEYVKNDYYVELHEICINGKCSGPLKQEDFRLRSNDDGGKGLMLVDSGCTYTQLDPKIFHELKTVLHRALDVTVIFKNEMNCFDYPAPQSGGKPDLVLKFPKADMSIPWASYVQEGEHGFCLYILEGPSILGNFQQHKVSMLYDLDKKELSFKRVEECSSP